MDMELTKVSLKVRILVKKLSTCPQLLGGTVVFARLLHYFVKQAHVFSGTAC